MIKGLVSIGFILLCFWVAGKSISYFNQEKILSSQEFLPRPQSVVFEVVKGMSLRSIAESLAEKKIIRNEFLFRVYGRIFGYSTKIRVGEYWLDPSMNNMTILETLSSGKSIQRPITFPEGINIYEMADQLERMGYGKAKDFLRLVRDKNLIRRILNSDFPSFEGYLFPETYHVTKYSTQQEIVEMMVNRFLAVYGELIKNSLGKTSVSNNEDRHRIVILASMVEKETGAPEERPMIASVFANRLRIGMRLQSDPTIIYGIAEVTGQMKKNITRKDLTDSTPYNTYRVDSLPAGPIANPGRESLRAVLQPAQTNYLYFVSRNDGSHVFSENFADHDRAVKKFQLDPRQREGKSWRNRISPSPRAHQ